MTETQPADPAAVTDEMVNQACVAYVMAGGFVYGENRLTVEGEAMRAALRAALGAPTPEPVPQEPPDLTILPGFGGTVWQRIDSTTADEYRWWRTGYSDPRIWADAVKEGADPSRRLVELPDPDDQQAMIRLAETTRAVYDARRGVPGPTTADYIRALAEEDQR